jgi:hypothetical protein
MKTTLLVVACVAVITLGLFGAYLTCPSKYPQHRVNITHQWIFEWANRLCERHEGLHYIVTDTMIYSKDSTTGYGKNDYPCYEIHYFRCQDGALIKFPDPATHCFISEDQIDDTLSNRDVTNEYK